MADISDILASLMGGSLAANQSTFALPPVQAPAGFALPGVTLAGDLTLPALGGGGGFALPAVQGNAFTMPAVTKLTAQAADDQYKGVKMQRPQGTGAVPASVPPEYQGVIQEAAVKYGVDPALLAAQLKQESGFQTGRTSPAGAQGIAQFIPQTAAAYGVDVNDPRSSIEGMAHYMSDLLRQYNGDQRAAIAAYNGGDAAVQRLRQGNPYAETQQYLSAVQRNLEAYRAENATMAGQTIASAVPNPAAQAFLGSALSYQGVRYTWGGTSRDAGVDCSGLIIAAARDSGHPLPGRPTAQGIYNQVPKVDAANVQPGDLVFFEGTAGANAGERISHVGIVTEAGMMLNAPQPGSTVSIAPYNSAYWAPKIVGFGRLP